MYVNPIPPPHLWPLCGPMLRRDVRTLLSQRSTRTSTAASTQKATQRDMHHTTATMAKIPTHKLQKRKHQINSLAIAAAERELELMEKRGRAPTTKAETNAKYGW